MSRCCRVDGTEGLTHLSRFRRFDDVAAPVVTHGVKRVLAAQAPAGRVGRECGHPMSFLCFDFLEGFLSGVTHKFVFIL